MACDVSGRVNAKVCETLATLGVDPDTLDSRTLAQLEKIEGAIAQEVAAYRAAKAEMRTHMLSIDSISRMGGVSRPTIYNKKVLMDYLEARRLEEKILSEAENTRLMGGRLRESEATIDRLVKRDGELVLAYAEIDRLKEKVARLEEVLADTSSKSYEPQGASGDFVVLPGGLSGDGQWGGSCFGHGLN